jgi:ADP-ribose pyrophosphatase YjhB (NUDIX family)
MSKNLALARLARGLYDENITYSREVFLMADYISYLRGMVGHSKVIMTGASALVFDKQGRLLLQQRADSGYWGIPGGFMELGEKVEDAARREVFEETGLRLGQLELFAIYSGSEREITLKNGDEIAMVKFVFTCRDYQGEAVAHDPNESKNVAFFPLDALPENLFPEQLYTFDDLLTGRPTPIIA